MGKHKSSHPTSDSFASKARENVRINIKSIVLNEDLTMGSGVD